MIMSFPFHKQPGSCLCARPRTLVSGQHRSVSPYYTDQMQSPQQNLKKKKSQTSTSALLSPPNVLSACLKVNGQLCVKGQIPDVVTQFCCNPAIAANKRSVGREETAKELSYKTACSFRTEWNKKCYYTKHIRNRNKLGFLHYSTYNLSIFE